MWQSLENVRKVVGKNTNYNGGCLPLKVDCPSCCQIDSAEYKNTIKSILSIKKIVKSLPSHKAHRAALISVSLALSQTHCKITDTVLVYHAVCLFTPHLSLVLNAPSHARMARLS